MIPLMQYVIDLMQSCPYITVTVHAEGVGKDPDSYSIESLPGKPVLRPYLDGSAIKQYMFTLNSRKDTFTDQEKIDNAALYENVSNWMEVQARHRKLPGMGDGRRPLGLEAVDSGYPLEMAPDNNSGLYVMQCRLTYHEKARRI